MDPSSECIVMKSACPMKPCGIQIHAARTWRAEEQAVPFSLALHHIDKRVVRVHCPTPLPQGEFLLKGILESESAIRVALEPVWMATREFLDQKMPMPG